MKAIIPKGAAEADGRIEKGSISVLSVGSFNVKKGQITMSVVDLTTHCGLEPRNSASYHCTYFTGKKNCFSKLLHLQLSF